MRRVSPNRPLMFFPGSNYLIDGSRHCVNKEDGLKYAKALYEFYSNITQEEIDEFNDEIDEETRQEMESFNRQHSNSAKTEGYIYFVKSDTGYTKIGMTSNIDTRFKALKTTSPHKLNLICTVKGFDYEKLERKAHKHFKQRKAEGEWFDINLDQINDFVEQYCCQDYAVIYY